MTSRSPSSSRAVSTTRVIEGGRPLEDGGQLRRALGRTGCIICCWKPGRVGGQASQKEKRVLCSPTDEAPHTHHICFPF